MPRPLIQLLKTDKFTFYLCFIQQASTDESKREATKTFYNKDQEQNLLAVKHSLKQNRRAYMLRKNEFTDDVIDVVADGKIIERHIAKRPQQFVAIVVHSPVPVEEMALYH